jgi:Ca-activated chloride channel homolog
VPIVLTAVAASVKVDGPIVPGGKFEVQWSGPAGQGDYIAIAPVGAPEGSQAAYASARGSSPARLRAPEKPGDYEIRYVIGQSKRTLASQPVKVATPKVSLSAPGSVKANATLEVGFDGPGRYEDFIEIVPAGAPPKTKAIRSARASQGSPLKLPAPPSAGAYEIRYRFGDTGTVSASAPLTVE